MTRIHIICEGQTEEAFVNNLLVPYFAPRGVVLHPSLIGKPGHKGGCLWNLSAKYQHTTSGSP